MEKAAYFLCNVGLQSALFFSWKNTIPQMEYARAASRALSRLARALVGSILPLEKARGSMPHQKRVTAAELESAGPPTLLVGMLRSSITPMEKKEWVAQIFAAITTQDPSKSAGLVKAGAIGPLVALLSTGTESGQLNACSALASIAASDPSYQEQIVEKGGIAPLVYLLKGGSAGTQEQAINALASVSEDRRHQEAIIKAGALKLAVNLLKGGKGHTQVYAAATTANLATLNPDAQATVLELGALPLLLALLHGGKEKAQVEAARAISKIAHHNHDVQETVQDLEGIAPLLTLLNGRNIEATVQAAAAIAELARDNEETQDGVARAGGIGPLLAMLARTPATAAAQSNAASALAQLARFNRDNQDSMARMEALPSLALLLSGESVPDVQSMAAMAMAEICRGNTPNQSAAADLGCVGSLVTLLQRTTHTAVKTETAGAIWVLSDVHEANKISFAGAGVVKPLVSLLNGSAGERGEMHAVNGLASLAFENIDNLTQVTTLLVGLLGIGDMHAKSTAATVLWRLVTENPSSLHSIAAAGNASDVVTLLKAGSDDARSYALWALSLSISSENQAIVLDEGAVKPLVAYLTNVGQTEREQAASALARLALGNGDAQLAIAKAGAISHLILMLDADTNVATAQEFAAASLAELALLPDSRTTIVMTGGIIPFVALLREGRNDGKKFAASALARLAHEQDETAAEIARAGAVSPLVGLLNGDRGDAAQEEAAGALYELAANAGNRIAITDCDGIGPLVVLLGCSNPRTREHAEGGLVRLSIENSNRVLIIKQLVGMLYESGKEQAAAALANLASDSDGNRVSIVEAGGIRPLLELLDSASSVKAKENALTAITHLGQRSLERQDAIAEAGGIPLVVDVLVTASSNVKETSMIGLCSLAADAVSALSKNNQSNQLGASEAGAIPPLVAMLGSPQPEMQATAAGAISALSRDHLENQAAVARTGAIAPLCTNVRDGSPETKERSASALWALATDNAPNKATIAKLGGIEPLVSLLVGGGATQKTQGCASGALSALSAKHSENRVAIAKRLVGLLGSRVAERAVRVLSAVSDMSFENVANQIAIAKASGISPLITWMSGGLDRFSFSADAQREAARAVLSVASNNPTTQVLVAKLGGIPQLIELVSKSTRETQEFAARALWHLAGNTESKVMIAESGGIQPLVSMLSADDPHAQELAAVVIARLSKRNSTVSLAIADAGGILPLVRLIRDDASAVAQLQAAAAIAEVAHVPAVRDSIAEAGGIEPLVKCLASTVPGTPETAALALARMARDAIESGDDGGGEPDEPPKNPPEKPGAQRRAAIKQAGGVKRLVQMLEDRSFPGIAQRMWKMVAGVMGIVSGADAEGAASKEHNNIGVQEQVAATICDLTYGDVVMQDTVIEQGGIPPLLQILRTGTQLGQEYAARVIWHLCASVHNQGTVVDEGTIVELVALSRTGSEGAQELAAAVISDLARGAIVERERKQQAEDAAKAAAGVGTTMQEDEEVPTEEDAPHAALLAALIDNSMKMRVIDVFRKLDKDRSGSVDKKEFVEGLIELGVSDDVAGGLASLFDEIDANRDGQICYKELNKHLRGGKAISLAKELRDGAMGEIETQSKNASPLKENVAESSPSKAEPEAADGSDMPLPVAIKGDRLSAIAAAGGIYPLVGLVTVGSLMGKERAAGALWHLSVDGVNRVIIAKAGGIAPLVQLLDDGTLQAHCHVAEALGRLAMSNPDNQAQIAKKLVGLVALVSRPGAQQRAAHTLWELATNNPGAPVIVVNAGAISPLVMLLSTGVSEAKKEAAGALSTLALNNPSNQLAIATGLVALLGSGSAEAQEHVTLLMLTLASDADNRVAIAKAGAIKRLIMQLRQAVSLKAQELAAAALSHLTGDSDENVKAIQTEGGIEPLVELLASESVEAQAHAAAVLSDMTRVFRDSIARHGAIKPLVQLLSKGLNSDIKAEAAGALWSLSGGIEETQIAIATEGAIQPLVDLLGDPDMRTRRKAAGALTSLAIGSIVNQGAIASAKGIVPLVSLLGEQYDSHVQLYAAGMLAELARNHVRNQMAIAKAGSISPLVRILKNDDPHAEQAKEESAGALWTLSSKNKANQVAIATAGGIEPLVELLESSSLRAQEKAAGALSAIALDNVENKSFIATMLVKLLTPDDKTAYAMMAKAARAVSRLARAHPANQEVLATAGAIGILVGLLGDNIDPAVLKPKPEVALMQKEFASALWSMAANNSDNQEAIATAGGIPLLVQLLRGSSEVHGDAAGALWSLAAATNNQKLIADDGGITALVGLLKTGSKGAQETSAGALHVLASRTENRVLISDVRGIPLLVACFEVGSPEAKDQAADALLTMVVNNSVNQSAVAREAVAVLSNQHSLPEAQEHVTKLLRNLALDPENRASMATAGAIPQLARQLRDGQPFGQEMAAGALAQLALKSAALRVQVTQELVALLGSSVSAVRHRAAEALRDMNAEAGADSRMSIAMAGGIDRFVSLLKDGSVEAQEYALWSLWQSTDMASRVSIAEASCAESIIATLVAGKLHEVAKEHAAAVLYSLASEGIAGISTELCLKNKQEIVDYGGLQPLIVLLRKGSSGAKRSASLALAELSHNNSSTAIAITAKGGVSAFVEWLANPNLGPPEMAAHALAYIAQSNSDTQTTIAEEAAVPLLVAMVTEAPIEWQRYAAGALAALAENHMLNQIIIAEEGGIKPVVELLRAEPTAPYENATRALWHISAYRENKLTIAKYDGINPLVHLLTEGTEQAQEWAAAALESLTFDCPENQVANAAVSAIAPLVHLLGSENETTQDHAVRALLNISSPHMDNRNAVVRPLVHLLEVRNALASMKSAQALVLLAGRSAADRLAIAEAGAILPLVHMLGDGRNATTPQVRATAVLSHLSRSSENRQAILDAGGMAPLVKMLSSHNIDAHTYAAGAVAHLAANTVAQKLISEQGGIHPLVALLRGESIEAARQAAIALWHMEASSDNKGAIVKAGAIPPLVILLRRADSPEAQEAAAHVLADLSRNHAGSKAITLAGGIPSLVGLLKIGSTTAIKHAACTLWGMTSGAVGSAHWALAEANLASLTRAGAVPLLVKMMAQSATGELSHEHLGYAMATLNNLAQDASARSAVTDVSGVDIMIPIMADMPNIHGQDFSWLKMQAFEFLQKMGVDTSSGHVKLAHQPGGGKKGDKTGRQAGSTKPQMKVHASARA